VIGRPDRCQAGWPGHRSEYGRAVDVGRRGTAAGAARGRVSWRRWEAAPAAATCTAGRTGWLGPSPWTAGSRAHS